MRIVVIGGSIAGIYLAYRVLSKREDVEVVVVDPRPYHEFRLGIPMAFAGLLDFDDLVFYYSDMKRVVHVRDDAVKVAKDGVYTSSGSRLRGDAVVLAVDAVRIGPPSFSTVEEAELLYGLIAGARAVRFVVDGLIPPYDLQDIAIAVKTAWPEKEASIHTLSILPRYQSLIDAGRLALFGIECTDKAPEQAEGELQITAPTLEPHPAAHGLGVGPLFETQYDDVYLIGETSLIKMGAVLTPLAIAQQAAMLADVLVGGGYAELNPVEDGDPFLQTLTFGASAGIPMIALKSIYTLWRWRVLRALGLHGGRES